jgi:hypothetical protein
MGSRPPANELPLLLLGCLESSGEEMMIVGKTTITVFQIPGTRDARLLLWRLPSSRRSFCLALSSVASFFAALPFGRVH